MINRVGGSPTRMGTLPSSTEDREAIQVPGNVAREINDIGSMSDGSSN